MSHFIHITGASGSGVTTLGRNLARATGAVQLDTDDFYWDSAAPKFTRKRDVADRLSLLRAAMDDAKSRGWILSGSIGTWGAPLVPDIGLAIYLSTPTDVRLSRLRIRETAEFGRDAVSPGGSRYDDFQDFMDWASHYESGTREGRSRQMHETFLAGLSCPVLLLEGTMPAEELVIRVLEFLRAPR
jgi:adenylate kinase family enzyme